MSELPKRIQAYYASLKDEDILNKIKHLINMENVMGSSQNLTDQLQEFKNEADRRGLDYKVASFVNKNIDTGLLDKTRGLGFNILHCLPDTKDCLPMEKESI